MSNKNRKSTKINMLCLVTLIFLWQSSLFAVGDPLFFRAIDKDDGLSQSSILDIFQSSDGYTWIATQDGLNRYDGYEIRTFKHDPGDPSSLSDNFVWSIAEDKEGNLWIGTAEGGVNKFDPKTESFTQYLHSPNEPTSLSDNQVMDVMVDSQNRIWVATANGGLNLYQPQKDSFRRFKNTLENPNVLNSNTVKVVKESGDGRLWLGYSHAPFLRYPGAGFSLFNPKTGTNLAYSTEQGLSNNNVTDILPAEDGKVWISTYRGGLNLFDRNTLGFKQIPLPTDIKNVRLLNIEKDKLGNIWLSQMGGGLIELDTKTFKAFLHRPNQSEGLSLNHNSVSDVFIQNDILWVGTWQEGLNISNLKGRQFQKILNGFYQESSLNEASVTHISRSEKTSDMWLANSSALLQYDNNFNLVKRYLTQDLLPEPKAKTIRFVFADSTGSIWFNCEQMGLFRFTPQRNSAESELNVKDFRSLIESERIIAMAEMSPTQFAVGTRNKGLFLLDLEKNESSHLVAPSLNNEIPVNNAITKNGIVYDANIDGWWVATSGGGINFLTKDGKLSLMRELNEIIKQQTIQSVLPIGSDTLWLATQGNGLYRLRWSGERNINQMPKVKIFTESDGLASSTIGSLAAHGTNVWISTTQGVSFFESKLNRFHNFDIFDGTLPDYAVGVGSSVTSDTIVFGGFTGITYFSPDKFKKKSAINNSVINQLLINSKTADISNDRLKTPLQKFQVQYTEELKFHYTLSHFTLGFATLDYIKPKAVKYAFRLKGFDSEWLHIDSSRRFATYTNLDPGRYIFELKSTDHVGRWSDKVVTLPIRVEPAPWKTWWAYLGYIVIVLLIGSSFLIQRIKQINAIKERNEQLSVTSKLFENTSEGVILFDHSHRVSIVNDGYTKIMGQLRDDIIGTKINLPLVHNQREGLFEDILSKVSEGDKWQGELWAQRKSGEIFPVEIVIDKIGGNGHRDTQINKAGRYQHVALLSDITQRKNDEQKLKELAFFDELTLLPNRSSFEREVELEIEQCAINSLVPFAVMFVDLDNFKSINDSLGHNIGDKFLQKLSKRLRIAIEHRITIARLGGDEFLILIPNEVIEEELQQEELSLNEVAVKIASMIFDIAMQPIGIDEYKLRATCSFGIAIYPQHGLTFERLLRNADTAMYEAKKDKNKSIRCYNKQMNILAREQFEIAEEIREDVKSQCFFPHYQAKADTKTGDIYGLEVLTRWDNQKLGRISPSQFIPIAEERGLINALSEQVIETACRQILPLVQEGKLKGRMAINLSPVQFQQVDIVERLVTIFERTQFPFEFLEIEVTEGVAILDHNQALLHMEKIGDLGIHISLDDFGTGYSSLSYLHKFPLDTVKIDRSFVSELMANNDNQKVTSAIINMSHSLGMAVIAEGVENKQQLQFLQKSQCDFIQGFFFHKPCKIESLISFIDSNPNLYSE